MATPPHPSDSPAWIETWIAPPDREGTRKLFDALTAVTDASPYLTRVKRLVVDGPLRDDPGVSLYRETAWGVIRWDRALGRPGTVSLASGFSIVHQYDLSFDDTLTGRRFGDWIDAGQPQVWDGPDDTETHAVSFMLHGVAQWTNRVVVGLVPGVSWQPVEEPWMTQRPRVVSSPASLRKGEFEVSNGGAPVDLGVFEVIRIW